ncbi:hypothetical protein [Clostridium luticellarii]|uniref:Uncharacterized protein n=1 Tax=Clostridium luticellarii TaxID=1691940 RepID=A0A2T0BNQ9_9CLOT|nr:hypothetical protein [Clostridium luticellarii]PRR85505.1 hypothetical protein CLLU_14260 [Clostridium luticellarii]
MSYIDEFEEVMQSIWRNFIEKDGIISKFNKSNILDEIEKEMDRIDTIKKSNVPAVATAIIDNGKSGAANYFIINDLGYGDVCEECGSSLYILLLQSQNYLEDLDNRIWVPSAETYLALHIPIGNMARYFPVPINTEKDLWVCPYCKEIHNFKYDRDVGLLYNQDESQDFL